MGAFIHYGGTEASHRDLRLSPIPEHIAEKEELKIWPASQLKTVIDVDKNEFENKVDDPNYIKTYKNSVKSLYIDVVGAPWDSKRSDSLKLMGIFDTGAQSVCVKRGKPRALGWNRVGSASINGAVSSMTADIYEAKLSIKFDNNSIGFSGLHVWESPLPGDIDVLIGYPIISKGKLIVGEGFKSVNFVLGS